MTSGLKTLSSYYIELINTFPPRPITNKVELVATQNQINSILDKEKLTQDDRDYLKVLGTLVYDYEEKHEPLPRLKGVELFKALLEETSFQSQDSTSIDEIKSAILDILNEERNLTTEQINQIAERFHISTALLVEAFEETGFTQN